jgi:hypothetical protein
MHQPKELPALFASGNGSMPGIALFRWDAGTERLLRLWPRN